MVVVCSGAKAILDLPATLEYLETVGVLVVGYQTDEFPAFYTRFSGLHLDTRMDTPEEVAAAALAQEGLGIQSAILVTQPPPAEKDIPPKEMEDFIQKAVVQAQKLKISGPALTPYLLEQVKITSGGTSLITNLALLKQNARLAARIAGAMANPKRFISI
jgi:pseudouridine-5'-phosphate glycosidase